MLDIKKAQEEAKKELMKEKETELKDQLKSKMVEIEDARKIVRNLERELEDLIAEASS